MARGVNKVILVGNLGRDPDVRYTPNGGAVATLALATTAQWKDKQSGDMKEKTEWHKVVLFNRLGEITGEYLKKGSQIYIEGSLRTTKWQDKDGNDRYTTEIVATEMQMLNTKLQSVPNQAQQAQPAKQAAAGGGRQASQQQPPPDTFDDDIPF